MPVHLLPTRRRFLANLVAGTTAVVLGGRSHATPEEPSGWFAWLADTHVAADRMAVSRDQNTAENLRTTVAEVLAEPTRPKAVFIDGDLAFRDGQAGDYRTLLELLEPLRRERVPIHLALGNHDDRDHFRAVLRAEPPPETTIQQKHVSIVSGLGVRIILLDSLHRPNYTPGLLGAAQLAWLESALDADPTPAILFVHHNLSNAQGALTDTDALLRVIEPRQQVKAVVYGHSHRWEYEDRNGLHLVNIPAIAYPFSPDQPLGWSRFEPTPQGATLTLHAIGGDRSKDHQQLVLRWRTS